MKIKIKVKIQEREMQNNGTQINDIDVSNVLFDGFKPRDTFLDLKSEVDFWFICQSRHTLIWHILRKRPEMLAQTLPKKCLNTEFFWSVFSCIWTEYEDFFHKSPYSVQMGGNTDLKNSVFGHFLRSENHGKFSFKHICSIHPEKMPLRFGKNEFFTSKSK